MNKITLLIPYIFFLSARIGRLHKHHSSAIIDIKGKSVLVKWFYVFYISKVKVSAFIVYIDCTNYTQIIPVLHWFCLKIIRELYLYLDKNKSYWYNICKIKKTAFKYPCERHFRVCQLFSKLVMFHFNCYNCYFCSLVAWGNVIW